MIPYARGNPARWWRSRGVGRWGGAHRSPAAMFISPARRFTSLLALSLLLVLLTGGWWATSPRRVSHMAEVLLSNLLGGQVEVQSGRISISGTLLLSGVQLKTEKGSDPALTVFAADELELRFDWLSLLTGQLHATQVTAVHPSLILIEDRRTERWNYERLLSAQRDTGGVTARGGMGGRLALPVIVLREARVQWGESAAGVVTYTGATVIDGQLAPDAKMPGVYRLRMDERGEAPLSPREKPAAVTGSWDVWNNHFSASISDIELTDRVRRTLPRPIRELWDRYQLKGRLTALRTSFDPQDGLMLHVELSGVAMTLTIDENMLLTRQKEYIALVGVQGSLEIHASTGNIKFTDLRGRILGYRFITNGEIRGTAAESPFDVTVEFPNARLESYPQIAYIEPHTRDLLERLRPHGLLDLNVALRRSAWNGKVSVEGKILCKDMTMRYAHFTYPMRKVHGPILFTNEHVRFDDVSALADDNPIVMTGTCGITAEDQAVDFTVSSPDAVFDQRMAACVPEEFGKLWDQLEPWGRGRFVCHVTRAKDGRSPAGGAGPMHTQVEVDLVDGRVRLRDFPYPLHQARGKLIFTGNQTTIENLTLAAGSDDSGRITLNGVVNYPQGDIGNLQPVIRVDATDVPIDAALLDALPAEFTAWRSTIDVTGRLGLAATVRRSAGGGGGGGATPEIEGTLTLDRGAARARDGAWALSAITASVGITPTKITLESLRAKAGEAGSISLAGTYTPSSGALDLDAQAHWENWILTPAPPAFLAAFPPAEAWTRLKPAGPLDGDLAAKLHLNSAQLALLTPPATAPSTATAPSASPTVETYTLHLRPKGMTLSPAELPAPVEQLRGTVTVTPEQIIMKDMHAEAAVNNTPPAATATSQPAPAMNFAWAAAYDRRDESLSISGELDAHEVPTQWVSVLGPDASAAILGQKPQGAFTLTLTRLAHAGGPGKRWEYSGTLRSQAFATRAEPVPLSATDVVLAATGSWGGGQPGKLVFDGSFDAATLLVTGRTCQAFHSSLACESNTLSFPDIATNVAGGKLRGKVTLHLGDSPATTESQPDTQLATRPAPAGGGGGIHYDGTLVLSDADLAQLVLGPGATAEERKKIGSGRVTANIAVQESFGGTTAGRTGRGELVVREGAIYNVPLAMGLMQIATLRLPVSSAFETASMSYYIRDDKVTFEKILLESPGINLAGAGTLTLSDRHLDMTFVTESPNALRLPIITDIFRPLQRELLQIQVSGPLDNPAIRAVPLSGLANTLQAFLPRR